MWSSLIFFTSYQACTTLAFASFGVAFGAAPAVGGFLGLALLFQLLQYWRGAWYFYILP